MIYNEVFLTGVATLESRLPRLPVLFGVPLVVRVE